MSFPAGSTSYSHNLHKKVSGCLLQRYRFDTMQPLIQLLQERLSDILDWQVISQELSLSSISSSAAFIIMKLCENTLVTEINL